VQVHRLALRLVELVALALGLPQFALHPYFTRPTEALRLLHYGQQKSDPRQGLFGAGAHTDYGFLTILSTDGNPGLEVLVENSSTNTSHWIPVLPRATDLVVNVGDFLHGLSDGRFKSAKHRVVSSGVRQIQVQRIIVGSSPLLRNSRLCSCRLQVERFSVPFFFEPNFETPMKKPYWDGDSKSESGPSFYSYGDHLLRKYTVRRRAAQQCHKPATATVGGVCHHARCIVSITM